MQKILDPEAGVIVDLITMKICVRPCIPRIQSRPSGITPICKYKDFVRLVSKTGTLLKPMQQESFSFFLFSAKRGGTSPDLQGKLSRWIDQLENIAILAEYFLLSQNTLVHASADGRKSAGESPDGAMMWPMGKYFSPVGHCRVDDAQEAML